MKRMLNALWRLFSSRALTPLVIGFFFLLYIGIAFFTDETLTVLIALTTRLPLLWVIFGLLPLNCASRIVVEGSGYLKRRRALSQGASALEPSLYDETVDLAASPAAQQLEEHLGQSGYRTRSSGNRVSAWRGVSLSPSRILFLAATLCLFAGILASLVGRGVYRQSIIEGSPFSTPSGIGGVVERITLKKSTGPILIKDLAIEVSETGRGGATRTFGVYPPALYGGAFAYPRYLGIALGYRFQAPDLPGGYEGSGVFPIYPPGKEAALAIPDSTYKITLSLAKPEDGSDPYMTGQTVFLFKLLKGADVLFTGSIPKGGEFAKDGFRLSFPEARRMVITDFVVDYGVLMIWGAGLLLLVAGCLWLPVRFFVPRREMLFDCADDGIRACSRAEGGARRHAGIFHEVLDFLAAGKSGGAAPSE